MKEEWRDIKGYEGLYQVSNLGRVRNKTQYILSAGQSKRRYLTVSLWKNNKGKTFFVHRLTAEAFISNIENKYDVNHKNGNKIDNRVQNLEWTTRAENIRHSYKVLKRKPSWLNKTTKKAKRVMCIETGKIYESARKAALELGLCDVAVAQGIRRKHKVGGFRWTLIG